MDFFSRQALSSLTISSLFRWKFGWIFICQKFLTSTCVYIWFFYENRGCKSLRKMLLHEIFRTLSNSRFFKASYADTFRKLENSRNSTNFYKSVRKNFSELPLMKFFYQMSRLFSCRNFSLRFNEAINVFIIFRAENIRIICSWVICYAWHDKKNSATRV